ncbi:MAG: diguanylate cyclase [Gammaproteobacteria bacterium]|nr:diguanylate cyclase [Gammaproteobacteria bacterium]
MTPIHAPQSCLNDPKVLLVDDREENLLALEALLADCDAILHRASSGNDALAQMLKHQYALVLLDVQMPGMDGYEVAELMQSNAATRAIPIIFVTAISKDDPHRFKGYESGAVDFLFKPIDPFILQCKVRVFIELWRQCQEIQQAMQRLEIANRKIMEQQQELHDLAIHDHLTGLYQRRWFDEIIHKTLATAKRSGQPMALALLDLDHFKNINDTYGHASGDNVLVQVSRTFEQSLRIIDTLFRYGGEEFTLIMPQTTLESAFNICERVRQAIEDLIITTPQGTLKVTVSIGVVCSDEIPHLTAENIIEEADQRLYRAKAAGRNRVMALPAASAAP